MTGASWRQVALMLLFGAAARCWIVADDRVGVWNAVMWTVVFAVCLCVRLKERPTCGFRLPLAVPAADGLHDVHHCADERGHTSRTHECRCGLGYTPVEVQR